MTEEVQLGPRAGLRSQNQGQKNATSRALSICILTGPLVCSPRCHCGVGGSPSASGRSPRRAEAEAAVQRAEPGSRRKRTEGSGERRVHSPAPPPRPPILAARCPELTPSQPPEEQEAPLARGTDLEGASGAGRAAEGRGRCQAPPTSGCVTMGRAAERGSGGRGGATAAAAAAAAPVGI